MNRPVTYLESVLAERWAYEYLQGRESALGDLHDYVPDYKTSGLGEAWYLDLATRLLTLPDASLREGQRLKQVSQVLGWPFLYAMTVAAADLRPSLCGDLELQAQVALSGLNDSDLIRYLDAYSGCGGETMTLDDVRNAIASAGATVAAESFEARVIAIRDDLANRQFESAASAALKFRDETGRRAPGNLLREIFSLGLEQDGLGPLLNYMREWRNDEPLRSRDLSTLLQNLRQRPLEPDHLELVLEFIAEVIPDTHLAVDCIWFLSRNNVEPLLAAFIARLDDELLSNAFVSATVPSVLAHHGADLIRALLAETQALGERRPLHMQCALMASVIRHDLELIDWILDRTALDQSITLPPLFRVVLFVAGRMVGREFADGTRSAALSAFPDLSEEDGVQLLARLPKGHLEFVEEIRATEILASADQRGALSYQLALNDRTEDALRLFDSVWVDRKHLSDFMYRYVSSVPTMSGALDVGPDVFRDLVHDQRLDAERLARICGGCMKHLTNLRRTADAEDLLTFASDAMVDAPQASRVILFNLLVSGYASEERLDDAVRVKEMMISQGIPVDRFTLGAIGHAMYRSGVLQTRDGKLRDGTANEWRALAVLVDDVVHELNQPVGRAGLALRTLKNARASGSAELADKAVDALEQSIRELGDRLGVYKGLTGSNTAGSRVPIDALVEQVVDLTRKLADAKFITIEHGSGQHGDEPLEVRGDAFQLRLALRALVLNAIQALSESSRDNRRILISTMSSMGSGQPYVEIYVRDNGPGIPEDAREKVFTRGYTTKPGRGLGLGLSLVQSVVENHGGTIILQQPDSGAEFWLRIPAYTEMDSI